MNALEIRGLQKHWDTFSLYLEELILPGGTVMGLVGENGAGKSTTIKLILDAIHPDGGTIRILGREGEPLAVTKQDIGVVMDEVGIPQNLTAEQVGRIMAGIYTNWDQKEYLAFLRRFDVPEEKKFKTLSRGTKMKLGLAVALSHHAKLLLLDEATAGLDPVARDELLDVLRDFVEDEEHAILISSHIVTDLEKICDYIAFLHRGQILACGEKDRLLETYGLVLGARDCEKVPWEAIVGRRKSQYSDEILVRRDRVPDSVEVHPVDLEKLFVYMVKGEN